MLHRINNDSLWLNRFFIPGVGIPVSSCRRDTSVSRAETKNTRSLASRLSATWSSSDKNWILLSKCCCFTWSKQTIDDNDFFIHSYIHIYFQECVCICVCSVSYFPERICIHTQEYVGSKTCINFEEWILVPYLYLPHFLTHPIDSAEQRRWVWKAESSLCGKSSSPGNKSQVIFSMVSSTS